MARYKLLIEYDGGPFAGWQRQSNGPSVQEAIENAAKAFAGRETAVAGAGRTDAGVHALAMTAHCDFSPPREPRVIRDALNFHLKPAPIAILEVAPAPDDFHARFACIRRNYEYRIVNRRAPLALARGRAWRLARALDAEAMRVAAQGLVGKHDFTTFRAAHCQAASPVKTLETISVRRAGDEILIACAAPSFLHHQVRSIAGSLAQVGLGRWRAADLKAALDARDRAACGPVAPAHGLYFARADYPPAAD